MPLLNIDNSTLEPMAECSTKMLLKSMQYAGRDGESDAMDCGNACHAGLEVHFTGGSREESINVFEQTYNTLFPKDVRVPSEDRFSFGNIRDHFTVYIDRHPVEYQPFEVLEAEQILGMPLDDAGTIHFWIKRDLKIRDKQTGFILPLDHKTTHRISKSWTDSRKLSSQLIGYAWATNKETGEMCPGTYVNGIELTLLPSSSAKCKVHKVPYSECRLEHTKSDLLYYDISQAVVEAWRTTAIYLSRKLIQLRQNYPSIDYIQFAPTEGFFNGGCFKFFKHCEFANFCRAGRLPHLADQFLVKRVWEPWNKPEAKFVDWRG